MIDEQWVKMGSDDIQTFLGEYQLIDHWEMEVALC